MWNKLGPAAKKQKIAEFKDDMKEDEKQESWVKTSFEPWVTYRRDGVRACASFVVTRGSLQAYFFLLVVLVL